MNELVDIKGKDLDQIKQELERIKGDLNTELEKYDGVAVTEESLPICKEIKNNLKRQSRTIDDFRKQVKKELSKPITEFEGKCKELQGLINDVVNPIDEGIREIDEKNRQEKIKSAKKIVKDVARKMKFDDLDRIEIKPSWGNVTTTQKAVKEDVTAQIQNLQAEDRAKESRLNTLKTLIEAENKEHGCELDIEDFTHLIDKGMEDAEIIESIKKSVNLVLRSKKDEDDKSVAESEKTTEIDEKAPKNGYLIRVYDSPNTAEDVIRLLENAGYFVNLEK